MGERPEKNGFMQKQFRKNIKADSQTKSLELGFLFRLLKIEEIYLDYIYITKTEFKLGFIFLFSLFRFGDIYLS
jgi:hypothetical protein